MTFYVLNIIKRLYDEYDCNQYGAGKKKMPLFTIKIYTQRILHGALMHQILNETWTKIGCAE
jgi:hypothetical protein